MTQEPPQPPSDQPEQPDLPSAESEVSLPPEDPTPPPDLISPEIPASEVASVESSVEFEVGSPAPESSSPESDLPPAAAVTVTTPQAPSARPPERPPSPGAPSLQDIWDEYRPLFKKLAIGTLRLNIRASEFALERLEAEPKPKLPAASVPTLSQTSTTLPPTVPPPTAAQVPATPSTSPEPSLLNQVQTSVQQVSEKARPAIQQAIEKLRPWLEKVKPYWDRGWTWWQENAIPKIRGVLPLSVNDKLNDRTLTGAIAGTLVLLLFVTTSLAPSKPTAPAGQPSQISQVPEKGRSPEPPTPERAAPPKLSAPEPEKPVAISPPATPASSPTPVPVPSLTPSPIPAVKPSPSLDLTPEQSLIAAIQDQVAEVTNQYTNELIESIQANFRSSRLIVKVSQDWYGLTSLRQDRLANEMLKRAKKLDFTKLEITDSEGILLARSPVVGESMIILRRTLEGIEPVEVAPAGNIG